MYSQTDIRYSVSDSIQQVRSLVHAFPGNMTLCLENKILYQYCEYGSDETLPTDNGSTILSTTDTSLRTRWIASDLYSAKSFSGSFTVNDAGWELNGDVYRYTVIFPGAINIAQTVLLDSNHRLVYPEDVIFTSSNGLVAVTIIVSAVPDCRFNGSYSVFFDRMI